MTSNYLATALMILVGVGFALALTALAKYIGPRRFNKAKDVPYECGSDVIGSPRARFEVKFYQVAIVFLVFDIETAFLYPWALRYRALSCAGAVDAATATCSGGISLFGIGEILVFMGILVVALAYVWRKRAVGWE
jgi:NADH-quinone oxidoreductase subunit A